MHRQDHSGIVLLGVLAIVAIGVMKTPLEDVFLSILGLG